MASSPQFVRTIKPIKAAKSAPEKEAKGWALPVEGDGLGAEETDAPVDAAVTVFGVDTLELVGVEVEVEGAVTVALPELGTLRVDAGPPGVPEAVDTAEIVGLLAELDSPSTSFSVMVKGELVARTLLMFETSTN